MNVARTLGEIRAAVGAIRSAGRRVGLVPTMGALHEGHFSLVEAARRDGLDVVVSIFVNPIQFGPREDLSRYPRPLEADLQGCRRRGVAAVFVPDVATMYPEGFATRVSVAGLTDHLCGASRPGHFDGVCTVVAKLFNIVGPDRAYFGAKDYQQAAVIRRMTADLDLPLEIVVCPIVREGDGLAMSSRNVYLSPDERRQAVQLHQALEQARALVAGGQQRPDVICQAIRDHLAAEAPLGKVDYVEIIDPDDLHIVKAIGAPVVVALAVKFPSARLIDNLTIHPPGRPVA